MSFVNLSKLIVLAAIWGSSFLFMRVAAHEVAPPFLIALRVGLGALFLLAVAVWQRKALDIRAHWKHFLILGLLNTAVPFTLFAFAAKTLPASLIIAGALGNLVDRVRYGHVVDFVDWYYGSYHWPAFNVADAAIVGGAIALVLFSFGAPKPAGKGG